MRQPLVSCIMPTCNRRPFIQAAIDCWLQQTYEPRELVILDDGEDEIRDLIPDDRRIRYNKCERAYVGTKRNLCCEASSGEIICHWDDDDWSAPDRISDQVERLMKSGQLITGYGTLLFWDVIKQQARRWKASVDGYVCGTTLCYWKSYWKEHPFADKRQGEDNQFVYRALKQIAVSHDSAKVVARIHACNTSSKSGVAEKVPTSMIPAGFWQNERLIHYHPE